MKEFVPGLTAIQMVRRIITNNDIMLEHYHLALSNVGFEVV